MTFLVSALIFAGKNLSGPVLSAVSSLIIVPFVVNKLSKFMPNHDADETPNQDLN